MTVINTGYFERAGIALNNKLKADFLKIMPRSIRLLNSVSKLTGEGSGIVITAAGTGLVAPAVIAYNPISRKKNKDKEAKNTLLYTALRQPVSAVLAIVTQLGVIIPFNKFIQYLSSHDMLPKHLNKTLIHDESYWKRDIKKRNPKIKPEELSQAVGTKIQEEYAKVMQMLADNGTLSTKEHPMNCEEFKKLLTGTIDTMLKTSQESLDHFTHCQKQKYLKRITFFNQQQDLLNDVFGSIDEFLAKNPTTKEVQKFYKTLLKKHKKAPQELKELLQEIRACSTGKIEEQKTFINKIKEHFNKAKLCDTTATREAYVDKCLEKHITALKKDVDILENAKNSIKTINESTQKITFKKILESSNEMLARGKDLLFEVVKQNCNNTNKRFKSYKDGMGLLVSFCIMPITCCLLNSLYPPFVEKFFPSLCKQEVAK